MNDGVFFFIFGSGIMCGLLIGMIIGAHIVYKEIEYDDSRKEQEKKRGEIRAKKSFNSKPKLRLVK